MPGLYNTNNKNFDPQFGTVNGRVREEDFSIDGKSWYYRDPQKPSKPSTKYPRNPGLGNFNPHANKNFNPLYEYSYGQVRDAAEAQGIGNVNSKKEVNRILEHIKNPPKAENNEQKEDKKEIKDKSETQATPTPVAPSPELTAAVQRSSAHRERMQGDRYNIYGGNQPSVFSERSKEVYDPNKGFEVNQQTSVTSNGQEQAQTFMQGKLNKTKNDFNLQPTLK